MESEMISAYFSRLGKRRSIRKREASRANLKRATAAKAAPVAQLEEAYKAVKAEKSTKTKAAADIAKCSYYTFLNYAQHRDAGWTSIDYNAAGDLIGLPPNARSPADLEPLERPKRK